MNEAEQEVIRKQAKALLDQFQKELETVDILKGQGSENGEGTRSEGEGKIGEKTFKEAIFENAPNKNLDCIIAEKKNW